jgi:hypothetical protein
MDVRLIDASTKNMMSIFFPHASASILSNSSMWRYKYTVSSSIWRKKLTHVTQNKTVTGY